MVKEFDYFDEYPEDDPFKENSMSAGNCEKCGIAAKTYWVADKEWLCAKCWKELRKS